MSLRDVPDPPLGQPTDVRVQVGAVGVCGSDIHYYTSGRIGCQVVEYPFTVGHECAGTVVETGQAVTQVRAGDRVAIEPALTCGRCDQCRAGRSNTCRSIRFLGCPGQIEGSLSEYLVLPQQNCIPIAASLSFAAAVISEPLAIGIYAVEQSPLRAGARSAILGLGPIGRAVLLAARQSGSGAVYGTDKIDARTAAAARAGAAWVGNPQRQDVVAEILAQEPAGIDVVYECCGQQEALDQAVVLLRPGGTLMILGIPEVDRISFDPDIARRKELTIIQVRRQCDCAQRALAMIGRVPAEIDSWITHRFPFTDTASAFDLVANYRDGVIKAIIDLA